MHLLLSHYVFLFLVSTSVYNSRIQPENKSVTSGINKAAFIIIGITLVENMLKEIDILFVVIIVCAMYGLAPKDKDF